MYWKIMKNDKKKEINSSHSIFLLLWICGFWCTFQKAWQNDRSKTEQSFSFIFLDAFFLLLFFIWHSLEMTMIALAKNKKWTAEILQYHTLEEWIIPGKKLHKIMLFSRFKIIMECLMLHSVLYCFSHVSFLFFYLQ